MLNNVLIQAKQAILQPGVQIDNVLVQIQDGVIQQVKKVKTASCEAVDLGEVVLIPGLVNAHTHLEFSDLDQPLGQSRMPFVDWLRLVIQNRFRGMESGKNKADVIAAGIENCADAGVVSIGEIATSPVEIRSYEDKRVDVTLFLERLSRDAARIDHVGAECETWLADQSKHSGINVIKAVSPHAPYSVHPSLLNNLVRQSIENRCPVAMHLAETREEIQLINELNGPFVDFLKSISAWYPQTYTRGTSILDYLKVLSKAPLALVVHGNYLTDQEISYIAKHGNMFVVFCPRTHAYFGHETYPMEKLIRAGVNVVIGTDSMASNPDLCLFEELKFIRSIFPVLGETEILRMAVSSDALGLLPHHTFIKPGNSANINVVTGGFENGLFSEQSHCQPLGQWLDTR